VSRAGVDWIRAILAAFWLAWAAARFGRSTGEYDRYEPDIARGYRLLGLPRDVDVDEVARRELRWWVVRREIGLAAGEALPSLGSWAEAACPACVAIKISGRMLDERSEAA
jgi:hypothetical protein